MTNMYTLFAKIRSAVLVFLTHHMALPVLRLIRKPKKFPYSMQQLHQMPGGTLGKDLANFLAQRKLKLLPHYAKHDIKHVLLQYDTTDDGEVCLQCFMLGNHHLSFPVAATVAYGFVTMPEHWKKFMQAYRRGKKSTRIHHWNWFEILPEATTSLILKINDHANFAA